MIEFDRVSLALGSFRLNDVSLTIRKGGVTLTAVLTRRSVQELGIVSGISVALSVKATAIHVIRSFS